MKNASRHVVFALIRHGLSHPIGCSNSGSLATLATMRRASSWLSRFAKTSH